MRTAGLVVVAPLPKGRDRIVATIDEAPSEPSLYDIQALLDARGPRTPRPRVEEVVWSSRFRVSHKLAARYREGPVFLCGDAAHVHSPAGGQGMNTGIQDAANLTWKLALVLRGQASSPLLDSYERERRPVARGVVATTDRLTRLATMSSLLARRIRNILIPMVGSARCRVGSLRTSRSSRSRIRTAGAWTVRRPWSAGLPRAGITRPGWTLRSAWWSPKAGESRLSRKPDASQASP